MLCLAWSIHVYLGHLNLADKSLHDILLVCCRLFICHFCCWQSCSISAFLFTLFVHIIRITFLVNSITKKEKSCPLLVFFGFFNLSFFIGFNLNILKSRLFPHLKTEYFRMLLDLFLWMQLSVWTCWTPLNLTDLESLEGWGE